MSPDLEKRVPREILEELIEEGTEAFRGILEKLIEAARRREIDLVLVWRLDRCVRSLMDLVDTLQELNALDVGFVSLSEALDLTTPSGRALADPVAESEFDRTVDPSRSGRRRGERERIKSRADPTRADHLEGIVTLSALISIW